MPKTLCLVVIGNRTGLRMVRRETLAKGLNVIIGALDQRLAGDIVNTRLLGGAGERGTSE